MQIQLIFSLRWPITLTIKFIFMFIKFKHIRIEKNGYGINSMEMNVINDYKLNGKNGNTNGTGSRMSLKYELKFMIEMVLIFKS